MDAKNRIGWLRTNVLHNTKLVVALSFFVGGWSASIATYWLFNGDLVSVALLVVATLIAVLTGALLLQYKLQYIR